jgi:hypothetical protein
MSFSREETILTCRLNNIISDEKNTILLKVKFNESLMSLRRNHFNSRIKHANDIAEILLQVALNTNHSINQSIKPSG